MTINIYGILPDNSIKAGIISAERGAGTYGVRFPLFDSNIIGSKIFAKTASFELLKSEVRQFIRTERGERVMLPNFGLSLRKYLFEPLTKDISRSIQEEIITGLNMYLPKAVIRKLEIDFGDDITGLGLPGVKIRLLVSPSNSSETAIVEVNL